MSASLSQFRDLLRQIFQIEDANLDFGIYRVLKQERHHIDDFLNHRLEPLVRDALQNSQSGDRQKLLEEQAELEAAAQKFKFSLDNSEDYQAVLKKLEATPDQSALETEVYNGLTDFFGRYYDDGDFLARPRYKRDVYALPYNGEEVKLHWANRDQYYIKSARVLDAFSFEIGDTKVCFQIGSTEAGAGDNNKETRKFVLKRDSNGAPIALYLQGVLTVDFEFRSDSKSQDALNSEAAPLLAQLPELAGAGEETLLAKLRSWSRRKDWDFFVHKDLQTFLARELDFYLKNEVVQLDNLFAGEAGVWEKTTLAKARAMHELGGQIIEFLASLEELQKRLWEKQKWVTQSRVVIPFGKVPANLRADVLKNAAQIEEWQTLYGVENEAVSTANPVVWTNPPSLDWALNHADISVDSAHFEATWLHQLWSELSKTETLDELWNGILFNADNFAALNLMQARFSQSVKCIYIDPPYNTGGDGFLYKDSYQHSSWISMMSDRLTLARELMSDDAAIFVSIDDNEIYNLRELLSQHLEEENFIADIIWQKRTSPDARLILGPAHDYISVFSKSISQTPLNKLPIGDARASDYRNPDNDARGVWASVDLTGQTGHATPSQYYTITSPIGISHSPPSGRCWALAESTFLDLVAKNRIWFGANGDARPRLKKFLLESEGATTWTWWPNTEVGHNQEATKELGDVLGNGQFESPKPTRLIDRILQLGANSDSLILDYFAGSGTTGHAVLNLNRADEGARRFVLCEMGRYFDGVLLPRLKKAAFADKWKDGKPGDFAHRGGVAACLWSYRLESYEDALEHLAADIAATAQPSLPTGDDFTVRYALALDSRDGVLPLSDALFASPFDMKMRVGGDEAAQAQIVTLDGVATFNWLLGLRVHKMWWPHPKLAAVCGMAPDKRAVVVIWRQLAGESDENADAALLEFWQSDAILSDWRANHQVATVYVNGDSTLGRELGTIELEALEPAFRARMFASVRGGI